MAPPRQAAALRAMVAVRKASAKKQGSLVAMSPQVRAYSFGTLTVAAGSVVAFLLTLVKAYDGARLMIPILTIGGPLVAALLAPSRRFFLGITLLPATCIILFVLMYAWSWIDPFEGNEGVIDSVLTIRSLFPTLATFSVFGAGIGWLATLRRRSTSNTLLKRTRE